MSKLSTKIELELEGRPFVLTPSLKAAEAVSAQFNGFLNAYQAISAFSLQVGQFIVREGCDHKDADGNKISTKDLNELVWLEGIAKITPKLTEYVRLLETGGKTSEESGVTSDEGSSSGNE